MAAADPQLLARLMVCIQSYMTTRDPQAARSATAVSLSDIDAGVVASRRSLEVRQAVMGGKFPAAETADYATGTDALYRGDEAAAVVEPPRAAPSLHSILEDAWDGVTSLAGVTSADLSQLASGAPEGGAATYSANLDKQIGSRGSWRVRTLDRPYKLCEKDLPPADDALTAEEGGIDPYVPQPITAEMLPVGEAPLRPCIPFFGRDGLGSEKLNDKLKLSGATSVDLLCLRQTVYDIILAHAPFHGPAAAALLSIDPGFPHLPIVIEVSSL